MPSRDTDEIIRFEWVWTRIDDTIAIFGSISVIIYIDPAAESSSGRL